MQDATKIFVEDAGVLAFFCEPESPKSSPEPSFMVSTSFTHSGDDEDSGDSRIILLFFLLESPESSHRTQL